MCRVERLELTGVLARLNAPLLEDVEIGSVRDHRLERRAYGGLEVWVVLADDHALWRWSDGHAADIGLAAILGDIVAGDWLVLIAGVGLTIHDRLHDDVLIGVALDA